MNVEILPAQIADKSIVRQMMELFRYDLSESEGTDLNEHGYFGYPYLNHYWTESDRHPFLVRVDDNLTGFVLVNQYTYLPGNQYSIAEFFILRKYRKRGIGRQVAFHIFNLFQGRWETYQSDANIVGQQFWRSIIGEYTQGNYAETIVEGQERRGIVQCFDNTAKFC
jgi:predicted acetyltransferase